MAADRDADVIVVGAGIGGLTTVAYLAAAGKRVLVVDRGSRPGGHGTVFERGGYEFDVGLHAIGSGMDGSPMLDRLLAPLGITLRWNRKEAVATSSSMKDPDNERLCRPGQTNLQLMANVPPQPAARGLQIGVERGEAYAAAKRAFWDQMMAGADRVVPGFSSPVAFEARRRNPRPSTAFALPSKDQQRSDTQSNPSGSTDEGGLP